MNLDNMVTLIYKNETYEDYLINKEGDVYSKQTNKMLKRQKRKNSDFEFVCVKKNGKNVQVRIRKCLREMFGFDISQLPIKNIYEDEKWKRMIYKSKETPYFISNYGRVYGIHYDKLHEMPISHKGYVEVRFNTIEGKSITTRLHRLVAENFLEYPNNFDELTVNHIDGNKQNNYYKNLEIITNENNIKHANDIGLYDVSYTQEEINKINEYIEQGFTHREITKLNHKFFPERIKLLQKKGILKSNELQENINENRISGWNDVKAIRN